MKILCLCNKDLASNVALNRLLPVISQKNDVYLWLSTSIGKHKTQPTSLEQLKHYEQDLFSHLINENYPVSSNAFTSFNGLQRYLSEKVKENNNINSSESIQDLQRLSPDLIISIRYGGILKEAVINIPTKGVINLHSGILPKYRGVMASFWAMLHGDKEIGTTLHTITDSTIDTGNIIKISTLQVDKSRSYLSHVLALYEQGVIDIIDAVNILHQNKNIPSFAQEPSDSYFTFPTEHDFDEFQQNNLKLVNELDYMAFMQKHYLLDKQR